MVKLIETELKKLIKGGETNTIELKVAAPRAVEMAERLCGMANAQGGLVIIGVKDVLMKSWVCPIIDSARRWTSFYGQSGK